MREDQNISLPPNDIQPLFEITDYSIYYFSGLVIILTVIFVFLLYLLFLVIKKIKDPEKKQKARYIAIIKDLDWGSSPKESAYLVTLYGRKLANTERSKKLLEEINEKLVSYKYIKHTKRVPIEIRNYVQLFLDVVESE